MSERTPQEVAEDLAPAYAGWKENEKIKEKYRKEFIAAITEYLDRDDNLAEIVVSIRAEDEHKAFALAEQQYPTWRIRDSRPNPEVEGEWEFILQENPSYKEFEGVKVGGKIWTRQVIAGSTFVDDERMLEEDPDLYREVTEYENESLIADVLTFTNDCSYQEAYEKIEAYCEQVQNGKRVLKDFDDLLPDQLAKVKPYIYEGKPTLKLPAPRKADGEE